MQHRSSPDETLEPLPQARVTATPLPAAWSRLLDAAGAGDASPPARAPMLGFLLELLQDERPLARIEVAPVLLETVAKGRLGRAVPLDSRQLSGVALPDGEARLAASVLGLPQIRRKGRTYAHLAGPFGEALLREILESVPSLLGGVAGLRLALGAPHPLVWDWELERDGRQRLLPRLPAQQRLVRVGGLWYLDPERAEFGPLDGAAAEMALIDAPPVTPEHAGALAARLAASPWAGRIPPPQAFNAVRRLHLSPQPLMIFQALTRHARIGAGTPPLAYARLVFDYGGERLPGRGGEATVCRVRDGKLVEIARRRGEELATMEQLEGFGLAPAVDCEGLPWDVADVLPEDAWVFPGTGYAGALEVNTPARWLGLREKLDHEGYAVEYAPSFPFEVLDGPPRWYGVARPGAGGEAFEFEMGIEVEGKRINLLPTVARALSEHTLSLLAPENETPDAVWYAPVDARRRVAVPLATLRQLLAPLAEYLAHPREKLRLPRVQAGRLEEFERALPKNGKLDAPQELTGFTQRLRDAAEHASDAVPAGLNGELRGYQHEGLRWLGALAEAGLGGVLADDMGLGKTVQMLAHILALKEGSALTQPALIVAPTSLIPNWQAETARFAPGLKVLTLHGPERVKSFDRLAGNDVILTSYALLPRDLPVLREQPFALVVLDEAQQVKNPRTQARRALLSIASRRRVCMTGTPLENHLGELWSQVDLAVPGLLGDEGSFRRHYRIPIERQADADCQARLNHRIAPFILRRTKTQVVTELPGKTEITRRVVLAGKQRELYDALRISLGEEVREIVRQRGVEHSGIIVLDALLKLRQTCCDPRLVKLEAARGVRESAKLELLMDMLPDLLNEGRRVLLFSQFTEMLALITRELNRRHLQYVTLTGDTRDRAEPVRRFQEGEVPLFLLSLKAGGVGLNLTAADTVIHYDPWWNPAAETQAADRAYRIGQDKPVFVYRLICAGTVEERIEAMKARKADLAAAVLEGGGTRDRLKFDEDDLSALFAAD
ncbi:MAG: DEAD/DEAH box helicase [Rhodanobacteraceae bacterium]|nr:MAG: DEAD/DEAH box helicase [Rhodanobacteraceae bacterium]